ncbi:hypothetical protein GETHLI_32620 [Geothrix limicola]|uniref:Transposase n=1 Tax=Geothrix limicola TaxID=2927978 RepID=A0ABQ5QK84_9BACT|nr:hypothetical protein [Geothrix limicola]GLH74760.1 hypothetical protein GETHLI_32620 [Geothrix limicola]
MATMSGTQILSISRDAIVTYTQSGTYKRDQTIYHPRFGFGTVIRVRYGKVEVRFGSEKRNRTLLCGMMTHDQRNEANGISAEETPRMKSSKRQAVLVEGALLQEGSRKIAADDIPFSMESFMNQLLDCSFDEAS